MEFRERDVVNDAAARADLEALGYKRAPVTVVGDERIAGFTENKLRAALGL